MLEAFFSSPPSFSTCAIFFALVTAMFKPFQNSGVLWSDGRLARPPDKPRPLCLRRDLDRSRVQRDPRPHARTQVASLDVLAFGHRRLRLDHARDQYGCDLDQFVGRE